MLCYRCGTYSPDGSRQCTECGEAFSPERRRSSPAGLPSGRSESSDPPPFAIGQLVAGHYRLKEVMARGASGWVMRARDEGSENDVAIKILDPHLLKTEQERSHFLEVVRKTSKIHHPNLARVFEAGSEGKFVFYTMTYLEGLTLRKIIDLRAEKKQIFSFSEAIPLVNQLAEGVQGLSKLQYHGSLSPNNVLVLPDILKITGVSHFHGLPHGNFMERLSKRPGGAYLSPEAKDLGSPVSKRSDVYSIAVIFVEMTTGIVYGQKEGDKERVALCFEPPMRQVLERALSHKPSERYPSGVELVDALLDAVDEKDYPGNQLELIRGGGWEDSVELQLQDAFRGELRAPEDSEDVEVALSTREWPGVEVDLGGVGLEVHASASSQQGGQSRPTRDASLEGSGADGESGSLAGFDAPISMDGRLARKGELPPRNLKSGGYLGFVRQSGTRLFLALIILVASGASMALFLESQRSPRVELTEASEVEATAIGAFTESNEPELGASPVSGPSKKEGGSLADKAPKEVVAEDPQRKDTQSKRKTLEGVAKSQEREEPRRAQGAATKSADKIASEVASAPALGRLGYRSPVAAAMIPKPSALTKKESLTERGEVMAPPPPPAPALPKKKACPRGMIHLGPGAFVFGSSVSDPLRGFGDLRAKRVEAKSFCIDIYEYPNSRGRSPTVNVTWRRAKSLCEKRGKRLCTEQEWERACKGPKGARFPTGTEPSRGVCNISSENGEVAKPEPIGNYPECRSGFGVADMAGNVAEWTASSWSSDIPDRVVKGGAADQASYTARCSARSNESSGARQSSLGFRCCQDF